MRNSASPSPPASTSGRRRATPRPYSRRLRASSARHPRVSTVVAVSRVPHARASPFRATYLHRLASLGAHPAIAARGVIQATSRSDTWATRDRGSSCVPRMISVPRCAPVDLPSASTPRTKSVGSHVPDRLRKGLGRDLQAGRAAPRSSRVHHPGGVWPSHGRGSAPRCSARYAHSTRCAGSSSCTSVTSCATSRGRFPSGLVRLSCCVTCCSSIDAISA